MAEARGSRAGLTEALLPPSSSPPPLAFRPASASAAHGATDYMSTTRTGADCTVASPCPCLSAAIGKATAGDTIEVAADGTYKGTCNKDITLDTPATHDITIKGTGGKAVFDFEGNGRAFRFTGGVATVVENFTWKNAAGPQSTESVNADGDTVLTLLDGTDSNQGGVI